MSHQSSHTASEKYFIKLCMELFKDNLLWIVNTDSYLRQPCYSSRAKNFFYFIFDHVTAEDQAKIKYINGEFPEYFLNYLTEKELNDYPNHGKWQFCFSRILYGRDTNSIPLAHHESDHRIAISHAIISVGHIARLYYLSDLDDDKSHTWGVRQLGWALRYAENGIVKLWNHIILGRYDLSEINNQISAEVKWLSDVNANWDKYESLYLTDINAYKNSSLKLNQIVQFFSKQLASRYANKNYNNDSSNSNEIKFINSFRDEMVNEFSNTLKCLYLSGSSARGDQHKNSDIDSIGVFSHLDEEILKRLKVIISKFQNTSVYTLSMNDLTVYPNFKYYTLTEGTKKIHGDISFLSSNDNKDIFESILNNIFILIQIARSYLIIGNYGVRAHYVLKLMLKLADHGCLRLIIKYVTGSYPNQKEEVKEFFKDNARATSIINYLLDINDQEKNIKNSLLSGNTSELINRYIELNEFGIELLSIVRKLKTE